mmetsp:Transcript_8972/g.23166  ORF Transcript_8972/g.23166 Transcript_8972/m.23166 type:complete len:201 (-) Transcript_8972:185-787(-)
MPTPGRVPAHPELRPHPRAVAWRVELLLLRKRVVVRLGEVAVHGREDAGVVLPGAAPLQSDQAVVVHGVVNHAGLSQVRVVESEQVVHVPPVVLACPAITIVAVLILDLHHNHGTAQAVHVLPDAGQQLPEPAVHGRDVRVLVGADAHAVLGQEPRGQAAELPLGADVWPRTEDDEQVLVRGELQELLDVPPVREVELSL